MGMDLITVGFTADRTKHDPKAVEAALAAITDDWLDEHTEYLNWYSGAPASELRDILETGAADYEMHLHDQHRHGTTYPVGESSRTFYIAGGGSWGDDPYDDWSALAAFIDCCEALPALATAAGFYGGGIVP